MCRVAHSVSAWSAISWARPEWLWALAVVPLASLAILWSLRRRHAALETFAEADVRARTQTLPAGRPGLRGFLLTLGLAALCLAAAGPQWGVEPVPTPAVRQHVVFALDVSRSMLAGDVSPSRLDRARLAVRQLLGGLPAPHWDLYAAGTLLVELLTGTAPFPPGQGSQVAEKESGWPGFPAALRAHPTRSGASRRASRATGRVASVQNAPTASISGTAHARRPSGSGAVSSNSAAVTAA